MLVRFYLTRRCRAVALFANIFHRTLKSLALRDLASVLGLPCWQVRWDTLVGLDMNFGKPSMVIDEPRKSRARSERVRAMFARRRVFLRGTHWLQIAPFTWKIELRDGLSVTASSSAKRQDMACHRLKGERLETIVIDRLSGRTRFCFDLGAVVSVRGARATSFGEYDTWSLHARARGRFVAIHSGGGYRSGSLSGVGDGIHPIELSDKGRYLTVGDRKASSLEL